MVSESAFPEADAHQMIWLWADKFGLRDWDVRFTPKPADDGLLAQVDFRTAEKVAQIRVAEDVPDEEVLEACIVHEMLPHANAVSRRAVPASHLVVGMQCGGSDGYSGITANPALGAAVDLLVRHGGTAILSETPEIYGAEHLLTRRAASPEIANKLIDRIKWWKDYTTRSGSQIASTVVSTPTKAAITRWPCS